jgi:hypothetical protein
MDTISTFTKLSSPVCVVAVCGRFSDWVCICTLNAARPLPSALDRDTAPVACVLGRDADGCECLLFTLTLCTLGKPILEAGRSGRLSLSARVVWCHEFSDCRCCGSCSSSCSCTFGLPRLGDPEALLLALLLMSWLWSVLGDGERLAES